MPADSRWSAVRNLFVRHAEAFNKAARYEEASAIADKAGREIEELCAPSPGEGDAPVAWRVVSPSGEEHGLFYHHGEAKANAQPGDTVKPLYGRPTPATPEGLREKVLIADVIRDDRATELPIFLDALEEWGCDDTTDQAKAILRFLSSEVGASQWREDDAHG